MNTDYSDIITRISRNPIIATGTQPYAAYYHTQRCCRASNVIIPSNTSCAMKPASPTPPVHMEDCASSTSTNREYDDSATRVGDTVNVKNLPMAARPTLPASLFNTAAFITDGSNTDVADKGIIRLSAIKVADNIEYSSAAGTFTINDSGMYYVSWNIAAINASQTLTVLSATFNQLKPSEVVIAKSSSVSKTEPGQGTTLTGNAVFTATAGSVFAFFNNTGSDIILSPNGQQATNVVIFKIS